MRIIKQGRTHDDSEHTTSCNHCGTVFAFFCKEAKRVSDPRDGDYWDIACPLCNKTVNVAVPRVCDR